MRVTSYSEARNRWASVLDDVIDEMQPTVIAHRGDSTGDRAVVMIPLASCNSMAGTAHVLRGSNRTHLMRSLKELKAGRAEVRALTDDDE